MCALFLQMIYYKTIYLTLGKYGIFVNPKSLEE